MKQVFHSPEKMATVLADVPCPVLEPGHVLVRNRAGVISHGPQTANASCVGTVAAASNDSQQFRLGDRVIGFGPHSEVAVLEASRVAIIPTGVGDDAAAFAPIAATVLRGIQSNAIQLGESTAVIGMDLSGLLAVQLLKASGCRVLSIDTSAQQLLLAERFGAETVNLAVEEDLQSCVDRFTRGAGIDTLLISSANHEFDALAIASSITRVDGRIIVLNDTPKPSVNADVTRKRVFFAGIDGHQPDSKTESKSLQVVLDLMAAGSLRTDQLITHRFPLERAEDAFKVLGDTQHLGVLLDYPVEESSEATLTFSPTIRMPTTSSPRPRSSQLRVGFIGAGKTARRILMPAFKQHGARLEAVATFSALSAFRAARRFGIGVTTTDPQCVLHDPKIDVVVIATRHHKHYRYVAEALAAGKHVYVENPVALNQEQFQYVTDAVDRIDASEQILMVGFHRRFAQHSRRIASLLESRNDPKMLVMSVNAGSLKPNHWRHDLEIGGGRLIGEASHFIDFVRFLCGHGIVDMNTVGLGQGSGNAANSTDQVYDSASIQLQFADESVGVIQFVSTGHPSFPQERLEVSWVVEPYNSKTFAAYGCWVGNLLNT